MYIEWRTNAGYDAILICEEDGTIRTAFAPAESQEIHNFLVEIGDLADWEGEDTEEEPGAYGDLVMSRGEDGIVLEMDAKIFQERLAFWFH